MRSFRIALLLIGLAGSSAILVAVRTSHRGAEDVAKPTRSLVGVTVRDAQHDVRALAPAGGGAVLVISATCPHCRATLGQLASGAAGASLAHLQIVTPEGTELGARLLDSLGIHAKAEAVIHTVATLCKRGRERSSDHCRRTFQG